jgi:hypothetical protein
MPTESRILGFNKNEVLEVLREYCTQTGRNLADDSVDALRLIQDREVRVEVRTNGNGSVQEFTESELGAAIIMYCIRRGIPMARHAMKSLEVAHETLLLHLRMRP